MDKQEEIRKNNPEFAAYLDNTKIFLEAEYRLGPIRICVVPRIDFTQKMFEPLVLSIGNLAEMTAFSNEKIMPIIFSAANLFYDKGSNDVVMLVIGNSMFTQMFFADEVTDSTKKALHVLTEEDERDLIPFRLVKAGIYGNKKNK